MKTNASYFRLILFFVFAIILLEWITGNPDEWAMTTMPMFWVIITTVMLFAVAFEICIEALKTILFNVLSKDQQSSYVKKEAIRNDKQFKWARDTYKKLLGSKPLEEEHEIILDHNYDGIQELDNNLPPWWVYMFYATIVFGVVYFVRFEVYNDYSQAEEYEAEVAEAKIAIAKWKKTAKNLVDVNTVTKLTDVADLGSGKKIFMANCIACHKADGGGGIGPNLTDKNWILGGGIKNVFSTISEGGRAGKGMISWKSDLKPLEMAQVASYVLTFEGTTPAEPKEAEGAIWVDPDAPDSAPTEGNIQEAPVEKATDSINANLTIKN